MTCHAHIFIKPSVSGAEGSNKSIFPPNSMNPPALPPAPVSAAGAHSSAADPVYGCTRESSSQEVTAEEWEQIESRDSGKLKRGEML